MKKEELNCCLFYLIEEVWLVCFVYIEGFYNIKCFYGIWDMFILNEMEVFYFENF